ncbi:MAG: RNase adapter RapZ [Rickettsiales bacterium]|nr:RNase adapter RapZ [Rickettsiales bacterium]
MRDLVDEKNKLIIVTGLSGAGRSTALKILEDIGYEAVDNLPFSLLPIITEKKLEGFFSFGIDVRSRDFDSKKISTFIQNNKKSFNIHLVYFDCESSLLIDRFKESRRPHPLKLDLPINDVIEQEKFWLQPLKEIADNIIDTTNLNLPNLRRILETNYSTNQNVKLNLRILSFGYKYGIPREADIVVDMRFIKNPFYIDELKKLTGKDQKVINYISRQNNFKNFYKLFLQTNKITLSAFLTEGKKFLTIAFGCTGGIHRSVMIAETFSKDIFSKKIEVSLEHRDLKK